MATKTHWSKPQLVVLGRADPQEAVLCTCKLCCAGSQGVGTQVNWCLATTPSGARCGQTCDSPFCS